MPDEEAFTDPVVAVDRVRRTARETAAASGYRAAAETLLDLRREYRIMPLQRKNAPPDRLATWDAVRSDIGTLVWMACGSTDEQAWFDERVATPADQPLPHQPARDPAASRTPASSRSPVGQDQVSSSFELATTPAYNNGQFDMSPETRIEAYVDGQTWPAGRIHVVTHRVVRGRDGYELEPIAGDHEVALIQVEPRFRRQGLATRLWRTAERTGLRPNPDLRSPGNFLTPAGAGFLESLRPAARTATDRFGAPDRSVGLQAAALDAPPRSMRPTDPAPATFPRSPRPPTI